MTALTAEGLQYGTKAAEMSMNQIAQIGKPKTKSKAAKSRQKTDRRTLRTRDTLGDALVNLMQEKTFDKITVQDLLDRAGVGRLTFYVHYRDKNDLFISDVEDFLEHCSSALEQQPANSRRLLPVREFFSHVRDVREFYRALEISEKISDVQTLARGFFARSTEHRLRVAGIEIDPGLRWAKAHALAGSFFSLFEWWVDKGMKIDPKEMDALFHRMAWSGLTGQ